jgi:hypothetical protein
MWQWTVHQWGRAGWAFNNEGAVWIQGFSAVVSAVLTAVLVGITWKYMRLTKNLAEQSRLQTEQSRQQLLLMAHPNIVARVRVDRDRREVFIKITNRGAYPFRLRNVVIRGQDDEGNDFTMISHELWGVTLGTSDTADGHEFLHDRRVELNSGAFEDRLLVEFDCEDLLGLAQKRYSYSNLNGLREVIAES